MNADDLTFQWFPVVAAALAGLGCGLVYFWALKRSVDLLVAGRGWSMPLCLTLSRIIAIAAAFTALAWSGAGPLLGAAVGFLIARTISVRAARRPA